MNLGDGRGKHVKQKYTATIGILFICIALIASACSSGGNKNGNNSGSDNGSNQQTGAQGGNHPDQGGSPEQPPLQFTFHNFSDIVPQNNNEMRVWLKENKNLDIEYVSEKVGDKIVEKLNLMLAGSDVPDVMEIENYDAAVEIVKKMGEAGLIIAMDEWIEKYPDLVKYGDQAYNDAVYRNKKDGKLYMIPTNYAQHEAVLQSDVGPAIREDWLQQVNMAPPETPDELLEVLRAFRDQIPDVNGKKIIPATFDVYKQYIASAWTRSWMDLDVDQETLAFQFNNPEVVEYLVFMNKLYQENLLDPEMLTQQQDQYLEKIASGRVGYTVSIYWDMDRNNAALKATNPESRFVPAPVFHVPGKPLPEYANPSPRAFSGIVVSKKFAEKGDNLERLMEFLAWNATTEGAKLLGRGPEGQYYAQNADGLYDLKPEYVAERDKPNSDFIPRTGLGLYNLLRYMIVPVDTVNQRTEEAQMGKIWDAGRSTPLPLAYQLTTPGPIESQKWGQMWAEFDKWQAKAIYADSEAEVRKIAEEMFRAFETNGGRDIVNERLESIRQFKANQ